LRRGWGLSQQGLNFIVVMVAAFMWIAAITHAILRGLKGMKEIRDVEDQQERDLWGE